MMVILVNSALDYHLNLVMKDEKLIKQISEEGNSEAY